MKTFNVTITTTDDADREVAVEALVRGLDDAIRECNTITDYSFHPTVVSPNVTDADRVSRALTLLREARNLLAQAGCPKVINRVRLAITSCKGAVENARHRPMRVADGRVKRIKRVPKIKIENVK